MRYVTLIEAARSLLLKPGSFLYIFRVLKVTIQGTEQAGTSSQNWAQPSRLLDIQSAGELFFLFFLDIYLIACSLINIMLQITSIWRICFIIFNFLMKCKVTFFYVGVH